MTRSVELLVSAQTEQDLRVEMVRMCIAEAGYDPEAIRPWPDPSVGFTFSVAQYAQIPIEVIWMARELAGVSTPRCLACSERYRRAEAPGPCHAEHRFVRDCADP